MRILLNSIAVSDQKLKAGGAGRAGVFSARGKYLSATGTGKKRKSSPYGFKQQAGVFPEFQHYHAGAGMFVPRRGHCR